MTTPAIIARNRDRWNAMFDWINARGGRKYPNETVVIWLLGHARTTHREQRVLDLGCGWCQSMPLFLNEGFEYWGTDVTDRGFPTVPPEFENRTHLGVFTPPALQFPGGFFSHLVSTEAIHLNPSPDTLAAMISECHRVLQPDGRMLATVLRPDYWFIARGYADWVGPNTVEVNERHPEPLRRGIQYFVFRSEPEIRAYFAAFGSVSVGQEMRRFGEGGEKVTDHWIISAIK